MHLGVAAKVTTLDKTHFAEVERIGILLKNRRTSAAASAAASLAGVKGPDDLPLRPEVRGLPWVIHGPYSLPWHGDGVLVLVLCVLSVSACLHVLGGGGY